MPKKSIDFKTTIFELDDGSKWTVASLAEYLQMSVSGARTRLTTYTDPELVLCKSVKELRKRSMKHSRSKLYKLDNGDEITVRQLMHKVGISKTVARNRLLASNRASEVYAKPRQPKKFKVSDGREFTWVELREITGVSEVTLRDRIKVSNCIGFLSKKPKNVGCNERIYTFDNGEEITAFELAQSRGCTVGCAQRILKDMGLKSRSPRKRYKLSGGEELTAQEIADAAGISLAAAQSRLFKTRDSSRVLAPKRQHARKEYTLADGTIITAEDLARRTGLTVAHARHRLNHLTDRDEIFKPHRFKKVQSTLTMRTTRKIVTEDGMLVVTEETTRGSLRSIAESAKVAQSLLIKDRGGLQEF